MPNRLLIPSAAVLCCCLMASSLALGQVGARVVNTRHNLSSSGPGPIKVPGETEVCKFCHTPHVSNPIAPLWNRADPGSYYQTYKSKSLTAVVGQPTGSSRLCLSCHDGTIALTETFNKARPITGTVRLSPTDTGHIGTKLTDDHPVSFVYDSALANKNKELRDPATLPKQLPLDHEGRLQCTTCHDPHNNTRGRFLRMDNRNSMMCVTCHTPEGWTTSAHATATASVSSASRDRWDNVSAKTVRELGCESCHRPHRASGRERLMRQAIEEDNCLSCHDGSVARTNVASEIRKTSSHPVGQTTDVHQPGEVPRTMPKHVECSDCHNPHQSSAATGAKAPFIGGAMMGASGATGRGVAKAKATYQYEVCYKCHAKRNPVREPLVDRWIRNHNIADKVALSSASYHPIEGIGKNKSVPSLLDPWRNNSIVYCTDCHGSDSTGVRGPHGSRYQPLLVRKYAFENPDSTAESPTVYALCYKCHNRENILQNEGFKYHKKHLKKKTSCSACHDPHGVEQNTHLINFDKEVVFPSKAAGTGPTFKDTGFRRGSCTLLCHNKDHNNKTYKP